MFHETNLMRLVASCVIAFTNTGVRNLVMSPITLQKEVLVRDVSSNYFNFKQSIYTCLPECLKVSFAWYDTIFILK